MSLDLAKVVAVSRTLTTRFETEVAGYTPFYPEIATVRTSTSKDENYGWLGAVPQMREWVGDRIFNDLRAATLVVENKDYEASIQIARNDIEDDRWGFYGDVVGDMGEKAAKNPDKLLATEIEGAGSQPVADGQYFYDTDHSWGGSGTQSNDISYDVVTPAAPTATEFKAAFASAVTAMLGFKDDYGDLFVQGVVDRISNIAVGIPLNMRQAAYEAFESVIISNSTNVVVDRPKIITLPQLTTTTKFHVWYLGGRLRPFLFQKRQDIKSYVKGAEDREFKFLKFMVDARYRLRALFWPFAVRVTLT